MIIYMKNIQHARITNKHLLKCLDTKRNAQKLIALEYMYEIHLENVTKQITVHKIKNRKKLTRKFEER